MDKVKGNASKAFSAGLGKGGRGAAWLLAVGVVAGYTYYENMDNGSVFSSEEQKKWNSQLKEAKKEEPK
ncbi:unnamed protein product [Cylindrotheca closterium]|uniref:Uncharacterized protein n=1 Tax=Cylindrotheca closterium TaxID=2856 RepID=A0AAD2FC58_9STRA|nr:unnamed protein product [Cylindrotheca closterium]